MARYTESRQEVFDKVTDGGKDETGEPLPRILTGKENRRARRIRATELGLRLVRNTGKLTD
jgi:hypothetical protein